MLSNKGGRFAAAYLGDTLVTAAVAVFSTSNAECGAGAIG
jgi:hypothetical protein